METMDTNEYVRLVPAASMQAKVHEFLTKHLGTDERGWPHKTGHYNKWLLIAEEFAELTKALGIKCALDPVPKQVAPIDEVATIDAICDLLYVLFNLCEELELPIAPFFDEVHVSNMTKTPGPLSPTKKIAKGPDWQPPRIAALLAAYRSLQQATEGTQESGRLR